MAYFKTATFNGLTGTNMTWDAEGMVSKMPTAVVVENGAYVKK
jgi:branched-chain amino acid transport system substrate-binding protein